MSFNAIWAITLRHYRLLIHDANLILATFYWPLLDIIMWGFLGSWIQNMQVEEGVNYKMIALLGIVLWQTTSRSAISTANAFVEELWSRNLLNILSLPISLFEWVLGITLYNFLLSCFTSLYCMILIYILYDFSIVIFFKLFCIFAFPLFISGLWLGFICLQMVTIFGKRAHEFAYVLAWVFAPFSAAFYPKEVLPAWAQAISSYIPMSYVFQGMRSYITQAIDPTPFLIKGFALSLLYLAIAVLLFVYSFNKSKEKGLTRLCD